MTDPLDPYSGDIGPYDDDDYDYVEWASPAIRHDYEAALGRLILAHNAVDRNLTILIQRCLDKLGNPTGLKSLDSGSFATRVTNVGVLRALVPSLQLDGIDLSELSQLNGNRNVVAHGHFEQDPFSGEYTLIGKTVYRDYSTERLNEITQRLKAQSRYIGAIIAFGFLGIPSSHPRAPSIF